MPFRIFRIRTLTGANVVGLLVGASLFSMFFFITLYMQQVLGYSPIQAGLSYLPLALMIIVAAGIASQLVTRIGFKPVLAAGMVLIAAALAVVLPGLGRRQASPRDILGPSLLAATGLGFAFVTTTIAAVSGVRDAGVRARQRADQHLAADRRRARARGAGDDRQLAHRRPDGVGRRRSRRRCTNALNEGFQAAFLGGAVIAALGLVLTLVLIRSRDSRAHVELGAPAPGQGPARGRGSDRRGPSP